MRRWRDERGALEGFLVMATLALAAFACVVAFVSAIFIRHEQTRAAADFSALAAASSQSCDTAVEAARRNLARLASCSIDVAEARVTVTSPTGFSDFLLRAGAPTDYQASARAAIDQQDGPTSARSTL